MNDQHEELDISGVKIAIIDDAKTIRMMMSHTLKGMGCEVECAEDGYKALGMLRRFKPDLIFLDITMPRARPVGPLLMSPRYPPSACCGS
jgi:twitching motility two-component system response regulator PilG